MSYLSKLQEDNPNLFVHSSNFENKEAVAELQPRTWKDFLTAQRRITLTITSVSKRTVTPAVSSHYRADLVSRPWDYGVKYFDLFYSSRPPDGKFIDVQDPNDPEHNKH